MRERLLRLIRENWLTIVVVAGLAVGYMALRTSPTEIGSASEFLDSLSQGQPTVVYFYSNT